MMNKRKIIIIAAVLMTAAVSSFAAYANTNSSPELTKEDYKEAGFFEGQEKNLTAEQKEALKNRIACKKELHAEIERRKKAGEDYSYDAIKDFESNLHKKYFGSYTLPKDDPDAIAKTAADKKRKEMQKEQKTDGVKEKISALRDKLRITENENVRESIREQIEDLEKLIK